MEAAATTPDSTESGMAASSSTGDKGMAAQPSMPAMSEGAGHSEQPPQRGTLQQPSSIHTQPAVSSDVNDQTDRMDVDEFDSSAWTTSITTDAVAQSAQADPAPAIPAVPEQPATTAMAAKSTPPETIDKPITAASESTMDAVIFDVSGVPSVPMPNATTDEQLSPLHRMAEIALATSPIMLNGVINRGHDYRKDGSMVLPSQQYYGTALSLYVPPSRSARGQHEIDASRALSHADSAPVYPSSYPPSGSKSDPHPFGYRSTPLSSSTANGKRRSSADDSSAHRYTHSRLQPKNKSPPSFQVVQLRSGTSDGSGEGASHQQSLDFAKSGLAPQEISPSTGHSHLEQSSGRHFSQDPWQTSEFARHAARPHHPHPSYTDPIPHAQLHAYQPPGSHSNVTSPVMNHHNILPQPQTQNRLSLHDLVAAAEASQRESEHEQLASIKQESANDVNSSPPVDNQQASTSAIVEKKTKQKKSSKKKNADKSANEQANVSGSMDTPPPKNSKRKERDPQADTGIVGHIPLRENSRSISKLLWAEPGAKASEKLDGDDPAIQEDDEDIMPEESVPSPGSRMNTEPASKGKKRQSNGAVKPAATMFNGKSAGTAKGKGKKKDEPADIDEAMDEVESQPKKKGRKNVSRANVLHVGRGCLTSRAFLLQESSNRLKGKGANGQAKNRSGSLESNATVDKKGSKSGKTKSVQIDNTPEFHDAQSNRKGRVRKQSHIRVPPSTNAVLPANHQGRQAASPETIPEEEEEDNTLYCLCKKSFSEDGSTMVMCDV